MAFTETTTIQEIVILPLENNVQIKRRIVVEKDGEIVSSKDHYQLYADDNAEAVAILQAHNTKGIADASLALLRQATAEAALATVSTDHTAALAAVQAEMDAALATAQAALAAELAAKDAEIAALQVQVVALTPAPVVGGTPQSVTMRQARLALLQAGLLDEATNAVAGAGPAAQIEWEYSSDVGRNAALVQALSGALGLTDEQLDGLFVVAATL